MPADLFVDVSSNNARPNLRVYAKAGHRLVALKATEGTGYMWSDHAALTVEAHRRGLSVLHYHFARPGSGKAQADYFLRAAAVARPGDGLVIDCEVAGVKGPLVRSWLNTVHKAHPNLDLWVYGSPYFLRDAGIRPVHDAKLWLADYTTASSPVMIPTGWRTWDAWQFTDAGEVAGVSGRVDVSRLAAHVTPKPRPPKPAPKPTPGPHRSPFYRAWQRFVRRWKR